MKKETVFYIGNENFYLIDQNLNAIYSIRNEGLFDSQNLKRPIPDENAFSFLLKQVREKYSFKTVILSDICFNAGILNVENFPLSRVKRNEVLAWKLKGVLPYSVDSYSLKYYLTGKESLLYYALPITIADSLNLSFEKIGFKCWDIIPESVFIGNFLPEKEEYVLLFIVRKQYFSGVLFHKRVPVYVKIRKRVKAIPLQEEIKLVENVIKENLKIEKFSRMICSKEDIEGFGKIFKGFDFEY